MGIGGEVVAGTWVDARRRDGKNKEYDQQRRGPVVKR